MKLMKQLVLLLYALPWPACGADAPVAPTTDATAAPPAAAGGLTWERSGVSLDSGITTTSEDVRGNWYEKRKLFKEARTAYSDLQKAATETNTFMPVLDKKRDALVKQVTEFVQAYSFKEGVIDEQLSSLEKLLERERRKDIQLTEQERNELAEVKDKKKELELLKKDTIGFNEIIFGLDKAFATAQQQMERAKKYEQEGWERYDKIPELLNDELAEKMYLDIKSNITNVSLINSYLKNDLIKYLDQTELLLKDHITKITQRVDALQKRGIELLAQNQEEQEAQAKLKLAQEEQQKKAAAARPQGWLATILASLKAAWHWVADSVQAGMNWVKSWFVKPKPVVPSVPVQERATNPAPHKRNEEKIDENVE